jgi:hypothetical protein
MTFLCAVLAILVCGCTHAPTSVTVTAALPHVVQTVAAPEPEEDFGCGVYAKDGVDENAAMFRTCLEREVAATTAPCDEGGSPELPTLELAVALVDGVGGPADVPRAKALFDKCFHDVAVEAVLEHAETKKRDPSTAPLDTCDAFAQTTFASTECTGEHIQNEKAWLHRERRTYDARTRVIFDAATKAATEWQTRLGSIDYARYGNGSMRGAAMESRMLGAMKARRERLVGLRAWKPKLVSVEERTAVLEELERLKDVIKEDDSEPEVPKALDQEETAWVAYRDAEIALYEAFHFEARDAASLLVATEHTGALGAFDDGADP